MTRHFLPVSAAARRARKGDHLKICGLAVGFQRDRIAEPLHGSAPIGRARLTNFRRAIQG